MQLQSNPKLNDTISFKFKTGCDTPGSKPGGTWDPPGDSSEGSQENQSDKEKKKDLHTIIIFCLIYGFFSFL